MPFGVAEPGFYQTNGWLKAAQDIARTKQLNEMIRGQRIRNEYLAPLQQAQLEYEQQRAPALEEQIRASQLADEAQKIKTQYLPQTLEEQIALGKAREPLMREQAQSLRFKRENPYLFLSGPAQQFGAVKLAKKTGDPGAQQLQQMIDQSQKSKDARSTYYKMRASNWGQMTAAQRNYDLAKAKGLGFTYDQAMNLFQKGYTLNDLSKMKGKNLKTSPYVGLATGSTQSKQQLATGRAAELNYLGDVTSRDLSQYAGVGGAADKWWTAGKNLLGIASPQEFKKLSSYAGAYMLQPEIMEIRNSMGGGPRAQEIIYEMMKRANPGTTGIPSWLVTPELVKAGLKYADEKLQKAVKLRAKATLDPAVVAELPGKSPQSVPLELDFREE